MIEKSITKINYTATISGKELKERVAELPDYKVVEIRTVVNGITYMPEIHIIIPMEGVTTNGTN